MVPRQKELIGTSGVIMLLVLSISRESVQFQLENLYLLYNMAPENTDRHVICEATVPMEGDLYIKEKKTFEKEVMKAGK